MHPTVEKLLVWVAAVCHGTIVIVQIVRETFRVGYKAMFQWNPRPRPACLDDPTLGTHGYLHLEDVRIHYVASGPEDKPLMLFLHGFPEFWYSWKNQIREFQKDYRVVAIDMRGYGESDKPKGMAPYAMKNLVSDVKQVILALGYKQCTLVAHDWGGAVAWCFGRLFPDMLDKLIIMNVPPASIIQKCMISSQEQRKKSWYIYFFQLPWLPEFYFRLKNFETTEVLFSGGDSKSHLSFSKEKAFLHPLSKEDVDAYLYTISQPGALTPMINYYRAALKLPRLTYDLNYTIPVLVIWGLKDLALTEALLILIEKEGNPNITTKRIEESGHFVQMDSPELVNKIMREWLKD